MRDPHIHVEQTPMPGFGHPAMRALITEAIGLVPDLPKKVGTGRQAPPDRYDQHRPRARHLSGLPRLGLRRVPDVG